MAARATLLDRVAARLAEDPEHVAPVLRLIADPDAVPDRPHLSADAQRQNAERLVALRTDLTAHALTGEQVRQLLGGISRQALHQRVRARRLLALHLANQSWFPDWQFGPDGVRPGVPEVLAALPESPVAADRIMHAPLPEEGRRTPADLLAAGQTDRAVHYARTAGGDR
jgi:hypothetical protein